MIIKNTIARQDCTVATKIETVKMLAGEVKLVRYATENEFRALIQLGVIAESQGPPPLVQRAQPIDPALQLKLAETQTEQTPPVPAPVTPEKRQCTECLTMMIITTSADNTGTDVYFCPQCNTEESIIPKPVEDPPQPEAPAPRPATAEENERGLEAGKPLEETPVAEEEEVKSEDVTEVLTEVKKAASELGPKIAGYQKPVEKGKQSKK